MLEKLIRTQEAAAMLGMSPKTAKNVLLKRGLQPVDFGKGPGHGLRWLQSSVQALIQDMHDAAQKAPRTRTKEPPRVASRLATMSIADLYALTQAGIKQ